MAKEREEKRIEEMGDREDDDNPLIDADPAMLEEYKKQQELIKVLAPVFLLAAPRHLLFQFLSDYMGLLIYIYIYIYIYHICVF